MTNWCVVDGGALLHKVKWPTDSTFGEIVQMYVNYMAIKYGKLRIFESYLMDILILHQLKVRNMLDVP